MEMLLEIMSRFSGSGSNSAAAMGGDPSAGLLRSSVRPSRCPHLAQNPPNPLRHYGSGWQFSSRLSFTPGDTHRPAMDESPVVTFHRVRSGRAGSSCKRHHCRHPSAYRVAAYRRYLLWADPGPVDESSYVLCCQSCPFSSAERRRVAESTVFGGPDLRAILPQSRRLSGSMCPVGGLDLR